MIVRYWRILWRLVRIMFVPTKPPKTFNSALNTFISLINANPKETRESLINIKTPQEFATVLHSGLGKTIRNNWNLWVPDSPLAEDFRLNWHITHADDMSAIIMMCAWQRLNNQITTPEFFADQFVRYWASASEDDSSPTVLDIPIKSPPGETPKEILYTFEELEAKYGAKIN